MKQPNILVIITDQQHHRMLSCAGNPILSTPAMDGLAAGGLRLNRAYCSSPVCVPSRFSMFTGRMPSAIGMRGNGGRDLTPFTADHDQTALGHLLRGVGYDTWYGGKVHLPVQLNAERIGFTTFSKDERGVLAQEAADLITRSAGGRPWATVVSFINPHDICFHALRAFANTDLDRHLVNVCRTEIATLDEALIVPEGAELPPLPANWEPQENEPEAVTELINRRGFRAQARANWDADAWRRHLWAYARLTELVDRQIGQVLAALDASGQADDTLVVFTSDHGDLAGAHRLEHKSFFYEEAARVPLVLRLPGRIRAATLDDRHLANTGLDLLPTLCDYAGAPIPAHCLGRSLRTIAETGQGDPGFAFGENILGHMLCEGRFKYVRYERGAHAEQLYDLDADPGEMRNHRDRHPAVVARLSAALDQQIAAHAAVALGPLSSFPGHE